MCVCVCYKYAYIFVYIICIHIHMYICAAFQTDLLKYLRLQILSTWFSVDVNADVFIFFNAINYFYNPANKLQAQAFMTDTFIDVIKNNSIIPI